MNERSGVRYGQARIGPRSVHPALAYSAPYGIHTAAQDSTPMIVFIGQVGGSMVDREAFQEIDYRQMFGSVVKWATQIDRAERIPEYVAHAYRIALSGRPGPVVLALPEDMLTAHAVCEDPPPRRVGGTADAQLVSRIDQRHRGSACRGEQDGRCPVSVPPTSNWHSVRPLPPSSWCNSKRSGSQSGEAKDFVADGGLRSVAASPVNSWRAHCEAYLRDERDRRAVRQIRGTAVNQADVEQPS
jgi:hypothetical protein